MILEYIILAFLWIIKFIFGLFQIPAAPLAVLQALNSVIQFMSTPIGVLRNYIGDTFFTSIIVVLIAYVLISPIIFIFIWIYKRIKS